NKKSAIGVVFVDPQRDLGQKKFMSFEKVSDRHSLMQALEISTEFQYRGVNYKAGAKAKFASVVETSSIFESFVARARVDNAVKFTAPAPDEYEDRIASLIDKKKPLKAVKTSLNLDVQEYKENFNMKPTAPGARSIAAKGTRFVKLTPAAYNKAVASADEFRRVYGDCFVSAITLGAELCAVMTFKEFNKKKREDIETSIEGSGWGFHAEGGFTKKVSEYSKNDKLEVKYYEAGGKGDCIPTDVEGFLAKIEELPELAAKNPVPFKITLQRYDSLPNWPQGFELTSPTPYEALLRRYFEYKTLWDDIG
ncbi:MAG: hypothetical protein GTN76_04110, partial [Candidatus Aenigmarchaeota archaeon]|nr:hypothetical protein [Candidatus Aenigmarchaeota archaeon]